MASITSTGLGSGIDINGLVTKLVDAERTPTLRRLTRNEASVQARISSFGNFKSALSSFRESLAGLKNLRDFQKSSATSSNTDILSATADSNADLGTYKIEVKELAESQALASTAFASADAVVGSGTLTIKFGSDPAGGFTQNPDKGTLTLTLDSGNNTLAGVRDAINKANAGVSAAIVNDGSGYRLVLNAADSGTRNAMQISVEDQDGGDTDAAGLSRLAYGPGAANMQETRPANDAKISINGLDVLNSSNTIRDALKGVTLNLQQAQVGKTVTVTVAQNDETVTKAIEGMIKSFNDLNKSVRDLTGYDAETKIGGLLIGDATVRGGMANVRLEMSNFVQGLTGSLRTFADIGIATQKDGSLKLDGNKLSQALKTDRAGVAALFAVSGRPTDAGVGYIASSADTKAGSYAVNVTRAASQGYLNGGTVNSLVVGATANRFRIAVDGVESSGFITLTPGDYTGRGAALAAELQSRINGDSALKIAGAGVSVSLADDGSGGQRFVIRSMNYGSASRIEISAPEADVIANLGLIASTGVTGQDIAGSIGGTPATRGALSGEAVAGNTFTIDADNDELTVTVDGVASGAVTLNAGTYSGAEMAAELTARINADAALQAAGVGVEVSYDGTAGRFVMASKSFGATSQVEINGADINTKSTLGLDVGAGSAGSDAVGGTAAGSGQTLTAAEGDAKGMKLVMEDGKTGDRGNVLFSRGLIERLDKVLSGLLDAGGTVTARTGGLEKELQRIQQQKDLLEERMTSLQERLLKQFNAMDAMLARMQSTSSYLTQQLATLPYSPSSNNR